MKMAQQEEEAKSITLAEARARLNMTHPADVGEACAVGAALLDAFGEIATPVWFSWLSKHDLMQDFDDSMKVAIAGRTGVSPGYTLDSMLAGKDGEKVPVVLPGGPITVTEVAQTMGELLGESNVVFNRGGQLCVVEGIEEDSMYEEPQIVSFSAAAAVSTFEQVAEIYKSAKGNDGKRVFVKSVCPKSTAEVIVKSKDFAKSLPRLKLLTTCPVMVLRETGDLDVVTGYDRETGVYAQGDVVDVPFDEAVRLLSNAVKDFNFATPADRSRGIARIITPAMIQGGILGTARAPLDLAEANESQAGKGYGHQITSAIYNTKSAIVTIKSTFGGLDEAFDAQVMRGKPFISLDNIRGKVNSQSIEAFMTEPTYNARAAYQGNALIDTTRVVIQMTSNRAEITTDLANRCSPVRIKKQEEGYEYQTFPGGRGLLEHVRANQPVYLGAVFAIIKQWHKDGCQRTKDCRHDFRVWAQTMDWIVQNYFEAAPLLDGLKEQKQRMTNKRINWLRDVVMLIAKKDKLGESFRANDIFELLLNADMEIPGIAPHQDPDNDANQGTAFRAIGRAMKGLFGDQTEITIEGYVVRHESEYDPYKSRDINSWTFTEENQDDPLPF